MPFFDAILRWPPDYFCCPLCRRFRHCRCRCLIFAFSPPYYLRRSSIFSLICLPTSVPPILSVIHFSMPCRCAAKRAGLMLMHRAPGGECSRNTGDAEPVAARSRLSPFADRFTKKKKKKKKKKKDAKRAMLFYLRRCLCEQSHQPSRAAQRPDNAHTRFHRRNVVANMLFD